MCRAEYLHYLRVREWQDVHAPAAAGRPATSGSPCRLRGRSDDRTAAGRSRPACTGRCSPGCCRTSGHAQAAARASTSARAAPGSRSSPGSALARKPPHLVDGRRAGRDLPAVGAASSPRIEPEWAEQLAGHLVKRTYSEPHWAKSAAPSWPTSGSRCTACRSSSAAGSATSRIDPALPASCSSGTRWWRASGTPTTGSSRDNRRLLGGGRGARGPGAPARHRRRRRERCSSSTTQRVPRRGRLRPRTSTAGGSERAGREPDLLTFTASDLLVDDGAQDVDEASYPRRWTRQRARAAAQPTRSSRARDADGVTVDLPLRACCNQVHAGGASTGRCPGCARSWSPR